MLTMRKGRRKGRMERNRKRKKRKEKNKMIGKGKEEQEQQMSGMKLSALSILDFNLYSNTMKWA